MGDQDGNINGVIRSSNRRAFRQLIGVIAEYLAQDYEKVEIWRYLVSQGKLSISYPQFTKYVRRYVTRKLEGREDGKVSGNKIRKDGAEKSQPRRAVESDRPKKAETKRAFNHDPRAKNLKEYAYGKKGKAGENDSSPAEGKDGPKPE